MAPKVEIHGLAGCSGALLAIAIWTPLLALAAWWAWDVLAARAGWPQLRYVEVLAALVLIHVVRGLLAPFWRGGAR